VIPGGGQAPPQQPNIRVGAGGGAPHHHLVVEFCLCLSLDFLLGKIHKALHHHIFYDDPTNDTFYGNYESALLEFHVPLQGNPANTLAKLSNKVYTVADQGFPIAFLASACGHTAQLADMDHITCYHRATNFGRGLDYLSWHSTIWCLHFLDTGAITSTTLHCMGRPKLPCD
jgi:hypothetical protein